MTPEGWRTEAGAAIAAARRIAVLGVGNPEKGDDGAGPAAAAALRRRLSTGEKRPVLILDGGPAPENLTGKIRAYGPSLVIIIDAALGGNAPGEVFLVDPEKIADDGISTHRISLRWLVRYLEESIGSRALVLGIEPKSLEPSSQLTPEIKNGISSAVDFLVENLPRR